MSSDYVGPVVLGENVTLPVIIYDGNGTPVDPTQSPVFRIYSSEQADALDVTGTLVKIDTGLISNATNAVPIVITTTVNHKLETGNHVTISGVGGNTAANGAFRITKINNTSFSLDGSSGNGVYTSGGQWHLTGLYAMNLAVTGGNGFAEGKTYMAVIHWTIGTTTYGKCLVFNVV